MAKKEKNHLDKLVEGAVQEGIYNILENNPNFKVYPQYLQEHINQNTLDNVIEHYKKEVADSKPANNYEAGQELYAKIVEYVSSGQMLDKEGKKVILKEGLAGQDKTLVGRISRMGKVGKFLHNPEKGEKYFNQVMEAARDFVALSASGNYTPKDKEELNNSIKILKEQHFYSAMNDIMKSRDLLSDKKYAKRKRSAHRTVVKTHKTLDRMASKMAAGIFAFFGFGLVLGNSKGVTGNAIEFSEVLSSTGSAIGVGCILIGLVLFLIFRKSK
jgi:hypothetical protein